MLDVVCIGEALVDFLPDEAGRRVAEVERWTRCSGGSPANVAVGVARLGGRSALLGCVGEDEFGHFLRASLAAEGVDVSHLRQTSEGKTGLVFVSLTETGERSFSFHRTLAAELFLGPKDVDESFVTRTRAVHLGTNSLLWPDAQEAAIEMAQAAARAGVIVCCDPNLRLHLWADPNELRGLIARIFRSCVVTKLSDDEIEFVTGTRDVDAALAAMHQMGALLPIVTMGARGAALLWRDETLRVPAPPAKVVDTTGAGDGFTAAFLHALARRCTSAGDLEALDADALRRIATFACAVGARVVERMGAVAALPRASELSAWAPPDLLGR